MPSPGYAEALEPTSVCEPQSLGSDGGLRPANPLSPGSGRFWGAFPLEGFIQEDAHTGNDGYIGQVKNVPIEAPGGGFQVQQHETITTP